jgi:hypothetical protein
VLPFEFKIKFNLNQHYRLIKDFNEMKTNFNRIVSFISFEKRKLFIIIDLFIEITSSFFVF